VSSAEQSFRVLNSKYENGKILLIELLQAQNRLTSGKIALNILKYDHLIKMAELDKTMAKN
jgi:outer membrane protein TolC